MGLPYSPYPNWKIFLQAFYLIINASSTLKAIILVISDSDDHSTNEVLSYFKYYGIDFVRINENTNITIKSFILNSNGIDFILILNDAFYQDYILSYQEITGVWYRRGKLNLYNPKFSDSSMPAFYNERINTYFNYEIKDLEYIINYLLRETKPSINSYLDNSINKLQALYIASKHGLSIPYTFISNYKQEIENELCDCEFITKDIRDNRVTFENRFHFITGKTTLAKIQDLLESEDVTFPNLIQEKIDKEYEVRSFYLHGTFYSTAIFSQSDPSTQIDFRNYNFERMNRIVPYKLPQHIEDKLTATMKELKINCGSIDLIKSIQGDYIFLEINPIGQYSQVSIPGQYYLDNEIANYFKKVAYEK